MLACLNELSNKHFSNSWHHNICWYGYFLSPHYVCQQLQEPAHTHTRKKKQLIREQYYKLISQTFEILPNFDKNLEAISVPKDLRIKKGTAGQYRVTCIHALNNNDMMICEEI